MREKDKNVCSRDNIKLLQSRNSQTRKQKDKQARYMFMGEHMLEKQAGKLLVNGQSGYCPIPTYLQNDISFTA